MLLGGAAATFLRVNVSLLLASAWTIPVGVTIGFQSQAGTHCAAAGADGGVVSGDGALPGDPGGAGQAGDGAGHRVDCADDAGDAVVHPLQCDRGSNGDTVGDAGGRDLFHFSSLQRWTTVILPGIFPFLITGLVTASGGAWNASIIAEYFHLKEHTLTTLGLGAQISAASDYGNFPVLLAATIIMALMVVTINRLVWRPLYRLAETKYRLDG